MKHHLTSVDFRFTRNGEDGQFERIMLEFSPNECVNQLPMTIAFLESRLDELLLPNADQSASPYILTEWEKSPVYNEDMMQVSGGFDYRGRYAEIFVAEKTRLSFPWKRKPANIANYGCSFLRGTVRRSINGTMQSDVSLYASIGNLANLALLDSILSEPDILIAPKAMDGLRRIAALRDGFAPNDAGAWNSVLLGYAADETQ